MMDIHQSDSAWPTAVRQSARWRDTAMTLVEPERTDVVTDLRTTHSNRTISYAGRNFEFAAQVNVLKDRIAVLRRDSNEVRSQGFPRNP
jgi:hypothetical protein